MRRRSKGYVAKQIDQITMLPLNIFALASLAITCIKKQLSTIALKLENYNGGYIGNIKGFSIAVYI